MKTQLGRWWWLGVVVVAGSCLPARREPGGCVITGEGPESDVLMARAACTQVEQRFADLVGARVPAGTIVLTDDGDFSAELGSSGWRVHWPTTARLLATARELRREEQDVRESWETVLPHELGHVVLAAHLYAKDPGLMAQGYGTPLPDWIDEGVAVWMEPPADRESRLRQAALLSGGVPIDLSSLLRAAHPLATDRNSPYATRIIVNAPCECPQRPYPDRAQRIVYRYFRDGRTAADTTYVAIDEALDEPGARFYAQSYALIAFLRARGGAPVIRELFHRGRVDPAANEALVVSLPSLPGNPAEVEREWHAWLAIQGRSAARR